MYMDKEYVEKFDVIRRYHLNRLSDEELNGFEVYILENPDIIAAIETEKAINAAFQEHAILLQDSRSARVKRFGTWKVSMAAGLLLAVTLVLTYTSDRSGYTLQDPVVLQTFRGAGGNATRVNGVPIVQFRIDMGPAELTAEDSFTAELVDGSGTALFTTAGLETDSDGWLLYTLDGHDTVLTGPYELRIIPDSNPNRVSSYMLEFTSP